MAPQEVSKVIDIPEYARMCFSYDSIQDGIIYASYDSELFSRIAKLLAGKGKFSIGKLDPYYPGFEKLSKTIHEKIGVTQFELFEAKILERKLDEQNWAKRNERNKEILKDYFTSGIF